MIYSMIISLALALSFQSNAMEANSKESSVKNKKSALEDGEYSDDLDDSQLAPVVSQSKRRKKAPKDFAPPKKKRKKSAENTKCYRCTIEGCDYVTGHEADLIKHIDECDYFPEGENGESFIDCCDKRLNFDLDCFPDPFEWFPYDRTHPALLSPEDFVTWWKEEYSGTIKAFKSWKGYSSYLTALDRFQKIKCLEEPSPPISQFLDIYFGQIDQSFREKWRHNLEQEHMTTLEDVFQLSLYTTKMNWEEIGVPDFVAACFERYIDGFKEFWASLSDPVW